MKFRLLLYLAILSFQVNCARTVRVYDSPSLTYEKLTAKFAGRTVEILASDGATSFGNKIRIEQDSTVWRDARSGDITALATSEIDRITVARRRTVDGMLLGFTIGVVSGAVIGSLTGQDCIEDTGEICFDREETAVLLGVALSIPGAIIGAIGGASAKKPNHYLLNKKPDTN